MTFAVSADDVARRMMPSSAYLRLARKTQQLF